MRFVGGSSAVRSPDGCSSRKDPVIDPRVRRFCATAVTAAAVLSPAAAAPAATDGMIVHLFDETVDTGYLRAVKADGTGGVPLWATPGDRSWPTWSPDGNRLAYTVFDAPGGRGLYTTTLADEGERRVATAGSYAAFSADSTRMAYAVNPVDGNKTAIRVQGVDGSDDVLLSTEPTGCVAREFDDGLFWSAATNRILWACGGNLIGINPDGTDRSVERALPTLQVFAGDPPAIAHFQPGTMQLSPDGTTFAGLVQGMGGYDNDGIYTWRPSDGAHTRVVPWDYDERVSWPAFSGGGAVLYDRDWAPYATWRKALSGSD